MAKQIFTCIIFFPTAIKPGPSKYRNITDLDKFKRFAANRDAIYMNVYDKLTKQFIEQIKIG